MINKLLPFVDFLYILQLEEYYSRFYADSLRRFFFRRGLQKREKLAWTSRIQTTFIISSLLFSYPILLSLTWILFHEVRFVWMALIVATVSALLIPIWVLIANIILSPVYEVIKRRIQVKASKFVQKQNPDTKVVMISGSFGKTTTKNFLQQILQNQRRVQMTPGNINTPIGIAVWLQKNLQPGTEVLIIEADSDFSDKLRQCCVVTPPDVAVLTNIGDQHVYRFGGRFKNLAKGLTEMFVHAKPDATLITTTGTEEKFVGFDKNSNQHKNKRLKVLDVANFDAKKWKSNVKSTSLRQNLQLAIEVAQELGLKDRDIQAAIGRLELPDRRQKLSEIHGFKTIDDSYNISLSTAKAGVETAKQEAKRLKKNFVVITGGIPDLGKENKDYNIQYGEWLAGELGKNEMIILLTSSLHQDVLQGLKKAQYDKKNLTFAGSMQEAWESISDKFDPANYLILMQPELNDLYY